MLMTLFFLHSMFLTNTNFTEEEIATKIKILSLFYGQVLESKCQGITITANLLINES